MKRSRSLFLLLLLEICSIVTLTQQKCMDAALGDCNNPKMRALICANPTTATFCAKACGVCVNGGFSTWGPWSPCSVQCGKGLWTRTRTCTNPAPKHGGEGCIGSTTDRGICKGTQCPVSGGYGSWSAWSPCLSTCGTGVKSRTRSCNNPPPSNGGSNCTGKTVDIDFCIQPACPVNGGYGNWSSWSPCSETCGRGVKSRTRSCDNPPPSNGGSNCTGQTVDIDFCIQPACPVNGGYGSWSTWSPCSKTCGRGVKSRTRSCDNPPPSNGGSNCTGPTSNTDFCIQPECPENGRFSIWSSWTSCSKSCGGGYVTRHRSCDNPPPKHGGSNCSGPSTERQSCATSPCPDGGYSHWSKWSSCSRTCGGGFKVRTRYCLHPLPQNGGSGCVGSPVDKTSCKTRPCPVNGGYSHWSEWSTCTSTCGKGTRSRMRSCTNPPQNHGGSGCRGSASETEDCSQPPCHDERCGNTCTAGNQCECFNVPFFNPCLCVPNALARMCGDLDGPVVCPFKKTKGLCGRPEEAVKCAKTCNLCKVIN